MDSITQPGCGATEMQLVFKRPLVCSTAWPDGSDFSITGTTPVNIVHAQGYNCTAGISGGSTIFRLTLSAPLNTKGNYQLKIQKGADGNTLLDECGREIPAGSSINFSTFDRVNADFTDSLHIGCKEDTIEYFHDGKNDVNKWQWDFGDGLTSGLQNPQIKYAPYGTKKTQLIVSNGSCSDTSEVKTFFLGDQFKAAFEAINTVCPGQPVLFKNSSIGDIVSWLWDFGNGRTSNSKFPSAQYYLPPSTTTNIITSLTATDNKGCVSTATQNVKLLDRCLVMVPNAFTPNDDGVNDYLYPLNIFAASNFSFKVFSRYGIMVFESKDPSQKWNGKFKGQKADPGTYVWILTYFDTETGKRIEQKGTSILIH